MGKPKSSSRHVELERKFDVPGEAVTPSFDGLAAIARVERRTAQPLEAVYYDTPAHDLAAHRVTLRRRTGGSDAGWHLKLPGSAALPESRTEVQAPLQPDVPAELRDMVGAIVRDRPLLPVARIANDRGVTALVGADGTVVAEFCDDRVSACRLEPDGSTSAEQDWREWELEVSSSDAGALLDRLTGRVLDAGGVRSGHVSKLARVFGLKNTSGAPPTRPGQPGDAVHRAVIAQIDRLVEADRAVRDDAHDAVHQMRVATRQIRSLLQSSEDAFGLAEDAWVLDELRELAAVLGVARDAEVLGARYHAALESLPPELVRGPVAERLTEGARRRYQAGLRRSLGAMRSSRYFRLLDALDELVAAPPASGTPSAAGETRSAAGIDSGYRRIKKAARAAKQARDSADATPTDRDHAVHRIRKAAKRLRYIAEATGDTGVEKRAKAIQTLLGDHQDSVVSRVHLLEQTGAAHAAGEDTFTYGALYQQEADLALRCEEQLGTALKALRRSVRKARSSARTR